MILRWPAADHLPAGVFKLGPPSHSTMVFVTDGQAETTAMTVGSGEITSWVSTIPPATTVATTTATGDALLVTRTHISHSLKTRASAVPTARLPRKLARSSSLRRLLLSKTALTRSGALERNSGSYLFY